MSYLQDSAEACERILRKHERTTERLEAIRVTPATLAAVRRQGLTVDLRGATGAREPAPVVDMAKIATAVAAKPAAIALVPSRGRGRWRYHAPEPGLDLAAAEYEALPVHARYGAQSRLARQYGVKQPRLHEHLMKRRIARAVAINAAQPKLTSMSAAA